MTGRHFEGFGSRLGWYVKNRNALILETKGRMSVHVTSELTLLAFALLASRLP